MKKVKITSRLVFELNGAEYLKYSYLVKRISDYTSLLNLVYRDEAFLY